ncbi:MULTISPECIES: hypothetical protein [Rhizobium]|uniref:Uncharacterized protein n=1 Tax=Rhizobium wuzhouense TaxID=1986026 RepID=A0ABX5NST5_9HYPH|nr:MULTISPECIES: hypothetical protein [Rhizobium]PYB75059.1 hypothetical protein DMY87_06195 [Rhizobium wuzhouense]RKE84743.1 hypothetical protein DFO46_1515 [Rhizobium sp. AG855]
MTTTLQMVREGDLAVEVSVALDDVAGSWGPSVGLDDIRKLDRAREALRRGDLPAAAREGRVYRLVLQDLSQATGFGETEQDELKP